jgi:hypothetical protein
MELEIWKLDDLHWAWKRKYSVWHRPLMLAAGYPKALIPFHVPNNITCLCVTPLSFHIEILLNQHGQSALDTSRTASCRLVMNHLVYVYVLSHPPPLIYMWESVCTFMCIYLFSCPSACTTIIGISPQIFSLMYCCCVSIRFVICICPPGALIWLINLFLFLFLY